MENYILLKETPQSQVNEIFEDKCGTYVGRDNLFQRRRNKRKTY